MHIVFNSKSRGKKKKKKRETNNNSFKVIVAFVDFNLKDVFEQRSKKEEFIRWLINIIQGMLKRKIVFFNLPFNLEKFISFLQQAFVRAMIEDQGDEEDV